ncbi:MAG: DNA repair protein RadC [Bacilli bacterium]|nr:DNA repair protein RadC [Bacilli bacterium]
MEKLTDDELLALLLGTGTIGVSVLELAHSLIADNGGLFNLFRKSYSALLDVKGIGPGKALLLSACFELSKRYETSRFIGKEEIVNTEKLYQRYVGKLCTLNYESLVIVILDSKRKVVHEETMYKGSEDAVVCHPIEILKKVILHNGRYYYLLHNHPSGNSTPSSDDVALTAELVSNVGKLRVKLLDHIIIARDGYYSFLEMKKRGTKRLLDWN